MPRRLSTAPPPARMAANGALLALGLTLGGCQHYVSSPLVGFGGFIGDTHTFRTNPNLPPGSDENTAFSEGRNAPAQPLLPEPGDIWPGPPAPVPTLSDVEKLQNEPTYDQQPGNPNQPHGSSTPPGAPPVPVLPPAAPETHYNPIPQPPPQPSSPTITTPSGPLDNNGPIGQPGGPGTATAPGGGTSIVVPNGNGTSTVIAPDGSTTTIPTPR